MQSTKPSQVSPKTTKQQICTATRKLLQTHSRTLRTQQGTAKPGPQTGCCMAVVKVSCLVFIGLCRGHHMQLLALSLHTHTYLHTHNLTYYFVSVCHMREIARFRGFLFSDFFSQRPPMEPRSTRSCSTRCGLASGPWTSTFCFHEPSIGPCIP